MPEGNDMRISFACMGETVFPFDEFIRGVKYFYRYLMFLAYVLRVFYKLHRVTGSISTKVNIICGNIRPYSV